MKNLKGLRSCIQVLGLVSAIIVKFASFVEGGIFRVIENIINFCQAETADQLSLVRHKSNDVTLIK